MSSFIDHYQRGEYEQVWAELQALGVRVREEPLSSDALAVARETMRRVRHNLELLVPHLSELDYRFGYMSLPGLQDLQHPQVLAPPVPDVEEKIAEFEQRCGVLPLSLRAFYEVVGEVNLVGDPPGSWRQWLDASSDLDALYVDPVNSALEAMQWEDVFGGTPEEDWDLPGPDDEDLCDTRAYYALPHDCWLVPIAPDEWHKYGISGCGSYEIAVPNPSADARLLTERHRTTFVNYL